MKRKTFDPVAFWNAKRDEFLGKGVMSRVSNDSTAADVLRALAAEAAKQQAKKDVETVTKAAQEAGVDPYCCIPTVEYCIKAIEKEAGL